MLFFSVFLKVLKIGFWDIQKSSSKFSIIFPFYSSFPFSFLFIGCYRMWNYCKNTLAIIWRWYCLLFIISFDMFNFIYHLLFYYLFLISKSLLLLLFLISYFIFLILYLLVFYFLKRYSLSLFLKTIWYFFSYFFIFLFFLIFLFFFIFFSSSYFKTIFFLFLIIFYFHLFFLFIFSHSPNCRYISLSLY